jgi:transcriptional regulator with XRE-family HTH domain
VIGEVFDTLYTLGWALLAWITVLAVVVTVVGYAVVAAVSGGWRALRRPHSAMAFDRPSLEGPIPPQSAAMERPAGRRRGFSRNHPRTGLRSPHRASSQGDRMTDLVAATAAITNLYRTIGAHLAEARQQRGVRQSDLAIAVGLTRASIANIENGNQKVQLHTLIAAAQALGLDPADLVSEALQGGAPLVQPLPGGQREAALLTRRLVAARDHIDALLTHLQDEQP